MNKLSITRNKLEYFKSKLDLYNPDKKLVGGLNMLLTNDRQIVNSVDFFKNRKFINNLILKMQDGEINIKILI
jgi:exonuclease VII large subunit